MSFDLFTQVMLAQASNAGAGGPAYTPVEVTLDGASCLNFTQLPDCTHFVIATCFSLSQSDKQVLYGFENGNNTDGLRADWLAASPNISPTIDVPIVGFPNPKVQAAGVPISYAPNTRLSVLAAGFIDTANSDSANLKMSIFANGSWTSIGTAVSGDTLTALAFTTLGSVNGGLFGAGDGARKMTGSHWSTQVWAQNGMAGFPDALSPSGRDLFFDPTTGLPIDPAIAAAALGNPLHRVDGDASNYGTNLGTGPAHTVTGSFANV